MLADLVEVFVTPVWTAVVVFLAAGGAWILRGPLRRLVEALGVSKLSALGIDVEFVVEQTAAAYEARHLEPPRTGELHGVGVLAGRLQDLVAGGRVLWVDDEPENNVVEVRLLRRLGVDVESVRDTAEAIARLAQDPGRFDLVVSDWTRPADPDDGIVLLDRIESSSVDLAVAYYVGEATADRRAEVARRRGLGVVSLPDDLLRLVLTALATR